MCLRIGTGTVPFEEQREKDLKDTSVIAPVSMTIPPNSEMLIIAQRVVVQHGSFLLGLVEPLEEPMTYGIAVA